MSASIGMTAEIDRSDFIAIMKRIKDLCSANGVVSGLHIVNPSLKELKLRIEEGYRFIAYSIDSAMLQSMADYETD